MNRGKLIIICATLCLTIQSSASVFAGIYSDDMAKCLVKSTSEADKNYLVKWMFAAASLHPEVSSIASLSDSQRNDLNRNTAELFVKLLTESCRNETQQALKYEGEGTIETSFRILGQVAARGLFSHPDVAKGIAGLDKYFDKKKFEELVDSIK